MSEQPINAAEEQFYLHLRKLIIERAEQAGYLAVAGTGHYNLGNYLRSKGPPHHRAAFRHYRLAAKKDPGYRTRAYFWRELGGVLFGLGRYSQAVKAYSKALDIDPKQAAVRGLTANALMFAGKYKSALTEFEEYLCRESSVEPEWHLKAFALEGLIKFLGIDQKKRQPDTASELADVKEVVPEKRQEKLLEALKADALCALAWFNLGVECNQQARHEDAFVAFLLAGLINEYDPEAWTNAISLGMSSRKYWELMPLILAVAYDRNGERIIETIHRLLEQQPGNIPKQEILAAFEQCFRTVAPRRKDRVFRFIEGDEKYQEIELDKSSGEA
jgi:tetratricopeptide (TPR) repeat protein